MPSYVAMRTDSRVREFISEQLRSGQLRQGWGYEHNQDLRTIRQTPRRERNQHQAAAWRGNRRLLEETGDGLQVGDIVLLPNIPKPGLCAIARISGPYRYEIHPELAEYGHIRPVSPWLTSDGQLVEISPRHGLVPAALRRSLTARSRMWSLDRFGDALEQIIAAISAGEPVQTAQSKDDRFSSFVGAMRAEAYKLIDHGWGGAELEDLVLRVLRRRYQAAHPGARVQHVAGSGERGIDILVTLPDPLDVSLKIGVQVKKHEGVETSLRSLDQIAEAHEHWGIHAGVILTTATEASEAFEERRETLGDELGIDIRVLFRDDLVDLVLERVAAEASDLPSPATSVP